MSLFLQSNKFYISFVVTGIRAGEADKKQSC